ncbi:hypothetical protein O6H91_Y317800 [Diphasiastrum complanatum]|nr:hypothetical protein O6H91_Y317800 [Diphasiastrum complanatum]
MAAAMPTPSPNSSPCPSSCSSQIPASLRSSSSARIHQGLQAAGLGLGLGLGLVLVPRLVRHKAALAVSFWATLSMQNENFGSCQSPMFNSLSLGFAEKGVVDQRTGVEFPPTLSHGKAQLAGIGLRKKNILGLKRIVVYAFGVYADADALNEKLGEKYAKVVPEKLKEDKAFYEDIVSGDIDLAVRLVIVYSKLKIGSVRSAFEESLGGRIKKFTGSENKELLHRNFTLWKCWMTRP